MSAPTKRRYIMHNQKCYACGKPQGASFLGYDPRTLKSYCLKNCRKPKLIPQGIELIPMDNDSLLAAIQENYTGYTEEMITSLLGKTASVRLQPAHIMHLMKVAELEGFDKIQATLVNIIENDMKERNLDHVQLDDSEIEAPEEVEPEEEEYTPEPEPEEPKTVEVKVDDKPVEVKEVVQDEEDDFSF